MLGLAIPISLGRKPVCKQGDRKALPCNYTGKPLCLLGENRAALSHLHTNSAEGGGGEDKPKGQKEKQIRKYGDSGGGTYVQLEKGLSSCVSLLDPEPVYKPRMQTSRCHCGEHCSLTLTSLPTLPSVLSAQPAEGKEEVTVRLRGSLCSAPHLPHGLTWDKTLPSPPPRFYSKGSQFLM